MAYQVLARKYRPQRFSDVAGQDHVTRTLINALTQDRIAHGYIFSGHRGIGKTTIARILAQALNCRNAIGSAARPTAEPCGVCDSCVEIRQGNAVDVIEIDAATNRGIDEIRELRDAARYAPSRDRYKIYILDEAHQITDAAFNALLKTLEEPPSHVVFMMATTEPESIPQTIRSRCQHFSFHAVKFDDILAQLKAIAAHEQVTAEDAALALLAEAGDGSMRDALSIMDQAIASAPLETAADGSSRAVLQADQIRELMGAVPNAVFERLMESVSAGQSATLMEQLDKLLSSGNSPSALARQLVRYLRNCLMAKLGGENTQLLEIAHDERARAARTALLFSEEELTRNLQIILRTFDDLNYRQEQRFHLELGLLKLIQAQRLIPLEEILSGLTGQAAASPNASRISAPTSRPTTASAPPPRPAQPSAQAPSLSPFQSSQNRNAQAGYSESPAAPARPLRETSGLSIAPSAKSESTTSSSASHGAVQSGAIQDTVTEGALARATVIQPDDHYRDTDARDQHHLAEETAQASSRVAPPRSASGPEIVPSLPATPQPDHVVAVAALHTPHEYEAESVSIAASLEDASPANSAPFLEAPTALAGLPAVSSLTAADTAPDESLDSIRDAVTQALDAAGHATAAVLLGDSRWLRDDAGIRIEVNLKPAMIRLTFNVVAEKIIRQALTQAGAPSRYRIVPGESAGGAPARARPAVAGSIEHEARNHPLVLRAQELFQAEIVSVIDLRDK